MLDNQQLVKPMLEIQLVGIPLGKFTQLLGKRWILTWKIFIFSLLMSTFKAAINADNSASVLHL